MRILLVEPDTLLARTYERALQGAGHTVKVTASAQTAVHLADKWLPDIVILELQLPRHNGIEFLYEFRSYGEWISIPVIIHTFVPLSELMPAVTLRTQLGVQRLLYKPKTSLATLCAVVAQLAPASV